MKKVIKLTESDLVKIVKKVISEQSKFKTNTLSPEEQKKYTQGMNRMQQKVAQTSDSKSTPVKSQSVIKTYDIKNSSSLSCIPDIFKLSVLNAARAGYDKLFLKSSLGIIGRESDYGESNRYKTLSTIKTFLSNLGVDTSVGLGQIKPSTAEELGLSVEDLNSASGSLNGVYTILKKNYQLALSQGYDNSPSSNLPDGTGNSALDISILAFNMGEKYITQFCETSNPNIKGFCTDEKTKGGDTVYKNKPVKNYIPNYKSERWDGVSISSHGYIKEVAKRIQSFNCSSIN